MPQLRFLLLGYSTIEGLVFFYDVYRDQRVDWTENRLGFDKSYVAHNERHNRPFQGTHLGLAFQLP
ncbi:hypothetical protein GCM10022296_06340 [Secundilactobacillus similis DSM 23365 = JCM 2765]